MEKKFYVAPEIEVHDVEMEMILAGSTTEGTTTGGGNVDLGGSEEEEVESGAKMNQQTLWEF